MKQSDPSNAQLPVDLPCDVCGYDLRAHPADGKCPECGASVAESLRLAANPRRPAWGKSDPRWRRRMLVGTWALVLLPLATVLRATGWGAHVRVPTILFTSHDPIRTLNGTLACEPGLYQPLVFCIGIVLLFSKERGRRPARIDWTRRWGVLCTYVVFLLGTASFLFVVAMVMTGLGAVLQTLPTKFQPPEAHVFAQIGYVYLRYGPQPMQAAQLTLVVFSSIAILLACVPLFDALRSTTSKRVAAALLAPLALCAVMHFVQVAWHCIDAWGSTTDDIFNYGLYFRPELLVSFIDDGFGPYRSRPALGVVLVEYGKWCTIFTIAMWLSIARLAEWRRGHSKGVDEPPMGHG